jgi:aspartyl/glutamyl-tRNA(Asn/Gln) amidotransferase C subunit
MAVSKDDVRHIAGLARIGVPEERLDTLVGELNGILGHMDALQKVATDHVCRCAPTTVRASRSIIRERASHRRCALDSSSFRGSRRTKMRAKNRERVHA